MTNIEKIMPLSKVEHRAIVSAHGDITIAYEATLPEIFTLSDRDYEAYHQTLIKAIRLLPVHTVFHKQDWFTDTKYRANFETEDNSFLSRSSERFFNERPYLDHRCYIFLTKKPKDRKPSSSVYSGILRKSIVPAQTVDPVLFRDFLDSAGQFERILKDSGFVTLSRLDDEELAGTGNRPGIIEKYCFLQKENERTIRDVHIKDGIRIGEASSKLFTLSDAEDLPALCGSRINYDKYSTDRTKFSIGFASPLGQLLPCNHIYNQYIFIEDALKTMKRLEAKKLRLQSLSSYSRENAISRDATNDFLNEAIGQQRLPIKAHFNVLAWSEDDTEVKDLKNKVSSALAQMDATPKEETDGAPQVWWAGLPGNQADFPMNDTFDTFLEQAACFLNLETNYRSSISPFGIRFGDRLTGRPVHTDISDEPIKLGYTTNRNKFIIGPSGGCRAILN